MDTITIHLLRSESTFDFDYLRLVLDTNKPFLSKNNTKKAALLSVVSVLLHRISKRLDINPSLHPVAEPTQC